MRRGLPGLLVFLIAMAGPCFGGDDLDAAAAPVSAAAAPPPPASDPSLLPPQLHFYQRMFTVPAFLATVPSSLLETWHNWPQEWGTHYAGFEKRAASNYAQFVIGAMLEDGVKAIDHEDTRYRRLGQGNFFKRAAHVLTNSLLARLPDGSRIPAYSLAVNAYGSWALATLWSPREFRTVGSIAEWGTPALGTNVAAGAIREFWPDLKVLFQRKKQPPPAGN